MVEEYEDGSLIKGLATWHMEDNTGLTDEEYENVKAFNEGMGAQQRGENKSDCPYSPDTKQYREWVNGFDVMILSDEGTELR